MTDTRKTLEQIRDLLKKTPPENQQALRLVKNLLMQGGGCTQALDPLRDACIMLLDRLVRPVLAGHQEQQARIGRLVRHIRTEQTFCHESLSPHLEAIAPWLAGKTVLIRTPDTAPPFPAEVLQKALLTLGDHGLKTIFPPEKKPSWANLSLQLGHIINRERRLRGNWQREQKSVLILLSETVQVLAEALRLLGTETQELDHLLDPLAKGTPPADVIAVRETLQQAIQIFQDRARECHRRLRVSRNAETRFRTLLRHADWALLDARDDKLIDTFTHLPNRFGLLARLERVMQLHQEGAERFTLVMIMIEDYSGIVRDLGRDRVNQLIGSLAERLASGVVPGDYLARFNDEMFALICSNTGEEEAIARAGQLRDVLDQTRFELRDARLTVRVGCGVVRHEKGESIDSLLGLARMAAKEALKVEGQRIHVVSPRQKQKPPPPARNRRFGF